MDDISSPSREDFSPERQARIVNNAFNLTQASRMRFAMHQDNNNNYIIEENPYIKSDDNVEMQRGEKMKYFENTSPL